MARSRVDIGSRLREGRERRHLSLRELAERTKISTRSLEAMERNEFGRLPGGIFRRAYVRSAALEMGLDGDALAREYVDAYEPPPPPAPAVPARMGLVAMVRSRPRMAAAAAILAGVVLAVIAARDPQSGDPASSEPAPAAALSDAALPAEPPWDDSIGLEEGVPLGPATGPALRMEVRARRTCWLSATADGDQAVRRLVLTGERIMIEAERSIALNVGDAGALAYTINGAPGRPLGLAGEVADIRITPRNVESFYR